MPSLLGDLERVPTDSLEVHPRNARRGDVALIAGSLDANQQYAPLVVQRSTSYVLAGNHTLLAARSLDWPEVDVVFVDVDDEHAAKIMLSANRTADAATYDEQALAELLADLPDLAGTGYDTAFLDELSRNLAELPGPGATDPDDVPDVPTDPISKVGDVWTLGTHRLVVGDAADPAVWEQLLDAPADAMWTDPPYGVAYVGGTPDALTIANDNLTADRLEQLLRAVFGLALISTREGGCWYVAAPSGPGFLPFAHVLAKLGVWRQTLAWVKDSLVLGRSDYHGRHESVVYGWTPGDTPHPLPDAEGEALYAEGSDAVLYGWTPGAAHHRPPDRKQDTVAQIARPKRSAVHPTMKPVELVALHLGNSTDPGDVVIDPFAGSGSTLIACHQLNRVARLVEIDPHYADVILRRWQEHTQIVPTRGGEAHDFTEEA